LLLTYVLNQSSCSGFPSPFLCFSSSCPPFVYFFASVSFLCLLFFSPLFLSSVSLPLFLSLLCFSILFFSPSSSVSLFSSGSLPLFIYSLICASAPSSSVLLICSSSLSSRFVPLLICASSFSSCFYAHPFLHSLSFCLSVPRASGVLASFQPSPTLFPLIVPTQ